MRKEVRRSFGLLGMMIVIHYASSSGLLDHLESGRCRSGMTRAEIHELVWTHDESRHITSAREATAVSSMLKEFTRYPESAQSVLHLRRKANCKTQESPMPLLKMRQRVSGQF